MVGMQLICHPRIPREQTVRPRDQTGTWGVRQTGAEAPTQLWP